MLGNRALRSQARVPGVGGEAPLSGWELDESQVREAYKFSESVAEELQDLGMTPRARPIIAIEHVGVVPGAKAGEYFDGTVPVTLRKLTLEQMTELRVLLNAWFAYVQYRALLTAAHKSEASKSREIMLAKMIFVKKKATAGQSPRDGGKGLTAEERRQAAKLDSRYVEADALFERVRALYNCMNGLLEVAKQDIDTVAQEISVRQSKLRAGGGGRGSAADPGPPKPNNARNFRSAW